MVEVTVSGGVDPSTGMVCNLVDLDGFVGTNVLDRYHLQNLNPAARIRLKCSYH